MFYTDFLQVNNSRYIMCSGATEGEMKCDTYVGKRVSFSAIIYILIFEINCIMYLDYIALI